MGSGISDAFDINAGDSIGELPGKPVEVSSNPAEWLKKNLFANIANTLLTVVGGIATVLVLRGVLNFVFSEERRWDAVRTNLRALMTLAYPESQYARIWVSVAVLVTLVGLSSGLWANWGTIRVQRLCRWGMSLGGFIILCILLREPSVLLDSNGIVLRDSFSEPVRESFGSAMMSRSTWWIVGISFGGLGLAGWYRLDRSGRTKTVSATSTVLVPLGVLVVSLWVAPYGHYAYSDGLFIAEPGERVALSTSIPWTWLYLLLLATMVLGRFVRNSDLAGLAKTLVNVSWVISPFVLYWVILRDPDFDYAHVVSTDLPMGLLFGFLGSIILWWLTRSTGETARIFAVCLVGIAGFNWVAAAFGWYPMLQKARISFLLLAVAALLAPNFVGELAKRKKLVTYWLTTMLLVHYMATTINSPSTVDISSSEFLGGLSITLFVAALTIMFSFPLGVLLALGRTSKFPIFRVLSTGYIEIIRGVPLITILIFFSVMVPLFLPRGMELAELAAAITGYTLFSAAYLAENVRGGLQSVRNGQFEAADALGLTSVQRTGFIVLPQALRVSIPPLVGQVIATYKETSLLAIIGIFDFLRVANSAIPSQTAFLGVKREGLLVVSAIYFIFAFTTSKYSQRLERRLGVGER